MRLKEAYQQKFWIKVYICKTIELYQPGLELLTVQFVLVRRVLYTMIVQGHGVACSKLSTGRIVTRNYYEL